MCNDVWRSTSMWWCCQCCVTAVASSHSSHRNIKLLGCLHHADLGLICFHSFLDTTECCIRVCCWHTNMQTEAPVRLVLYEVSHYTGCFLAWFKETVHNHLPPKIGPYAIWDLTEHWLATWIDGQQHIYADSTTLMLCGCHQLVLINQSTSEPKLQLVKQDLCLCPLAFQAEASHIMLMIVRDRAKAAKHLGTTCTLPHSASYALWSPCLVNQCDRYCRMYAVATRQ